MPPMGFPGQIPVPMQMPGPGYVIFFDLSVLVTMSLCAFLKLMYYPFI